MADFSVRSDEVDVEQIMGQIRARIREKRGVDYTEEEIHELARVKLERFLDPRQVRSDLLEQHRRKRAGSTGARNYQFEDSTLFASSRPVLQSIRRMLRPILKLFVNPNPLIEALHIQSRLNDSYNEAESLSYELLHNLVLQTTRLGIEVKNLNMRLESMSSRLDFDERRARALEGVVQYRPLTEAEQTERRTRRRRRRRRQDEGRENAGGAEAAPPAESGSGRTGNPEPDRSRAPETGPGEGDSHES